MFGRRKTADTCIPVSLDEPLTSDSCIKLIMELIQYVLYQKEQIPFSYDTLALLQPRLKPTDRNCNATKTLMSSLRNISENLTSQLHSTSCNVREVVIIIGATTIAPKLCIRVELPDGILNSQSHMEYQHSSRKPLLNLMRSIIDCQEFQDAMNLPLGVTNTFVLLQKHENKPTSDFFLPKPRYILPTNTTSFTITFSTNTAYVADCNCQNAIKVYNDLPHPSTEKSLKDENSEYANERQDNFSYYWYQSRDVIKGFKFAR